MVQFTFNPRYFAYTLSLFIVEFLIGKYAHDQFVRPYLGDFIIVIFLYCFLKAFIYLPIKSAAIIVLAISYITETLQYCNILDVIGLRQNGLANILLGNYFSWIDFLAYSLGTLFTVAVERLTCTTFRQEQLFI